MKFLSKIKQVLNRNDKDSNFGFNEYGYESSDVENVILSSMIKTLIDLNSRFRSIINLNKRENEVSNNLELYNLRLQESKELLNSMKDLIYLINKIKEYIYEFVKEIESDKYMDINKKYEIKNQIRSDLVNLKKEIDELFVDMEVLLQKI